MVVLVTMLMLVFAVNGETERAVDLTAQKAFVAGLDKSGIFSFGTNHGWLLLPQNYDPQKQYPFILFFHGRGGSVLRKATNLGSPDFAAFRKLCSEQGFILAVPDYGSDCWFNDKAERITMEMLDFLQNNLSIDAKRFYVMGCSMGGGAALTFTVRHPEMVSAVCDIFGVTDFFRFYQEGNYQGSISAAYGGTPEEKPATYRERSAIMNVDVLKHKPVLIIHGDADDLVPQWNSTLLADALKKAGGDVVYITVPGIDHSNAIIRNLEQKVLDFFNQNR